MSGNLQGGFGPEHVVLEQGEVYRAGWDSSCSPAAAFACQRAVRGTWRCEDEEGLGASLWCLPYRGCGGQ